MSGETPQHQGEGFVVPDESQQVTNPQKARVMAEASDTARTNEARYLKEQQRREKSTTRMGDWNQDMGAMAKAEGIQAENAEHGAALHYEADKLVDSVGEHVGLETVYSYEVKRDEARRDTEALQRTQARLFEETDRNQDIATLQRLIDEATDHETILSFAFTKLRSKAQEQSGHEPFSENYQEYKSSKRKVV